MSDALKGAARGLTADVLGSPVDLATTVANLGVAGAGYLAHKLRLIKQPPELIDPKNVPFSSDWHVKNSPLEDNGSVGYTSWRIAAALSPMFAAAASKVPRPRQGQTNALFPGGRDDLLLSHNMDDTAPEKSPNEFYNLSGAIVKGQVPSAFGNITAVLNPRKLEPRTSPTVIKNRDFYSPRRHSSRMGGGFTSMKDLDFFPEAIAVKEAEIDVNSIKYMLETEKNPQYRQVWAEKLKDAQESYAHLQRQQALSLRNAANARLSDRFLTAFPEAGVRAEGAPTTDLTNRLERLGQNPTQLANKVVNRDNSWTMAMLASPRFQSFRHFEKDPRGAKVLVGPQDPPTDPAMVNGTIDSALKDHVRRTVRWEDARSDPDMPYARDLPSDWLEGKKFYNLVDSMAGTKPKELYTGVQRLISSDTGQVVTPKEAEQIVATIRALRKQYSRVPSEYAETKTFGALPINRETIGGIYAHPEADPTAAKAMARKKGIPFMQGTGWKASEDDFEQLVDWQNYVQRRQR